MKMGVEPRNQAYWAICKDRISYVRPLFSAMFLLPKKDKTKEKHEQRIPELGGTLSLTPLVFSTTREMGKQ